MRRMVNGIIIISSAVKLSAMPTPMEMRASLSAVTVSSNLSE